MTPYQLRFLKTSELAGALEMIGADPRSLPFFDNRRTLRILFLPHIDVSAANIIKQEMLSLGGDAAVNKHAIDCSAPFSDALLFGTKKQLAMLADKIATMKWRGLPETADSVRAALAGLAAKEGGTEIPLPGGRALSRGGRTLIMGIVNLTDDSFYSESRTFGDADKALEMALRLADEGADIIDIGAESTRPGSHGTNESEELSRMSTAVKKIRSALPGMPLSADTTRASVARAALEEGADIVNDISGLARDTDIAATAAKFGAAYVLTHMRGTPETMRDQCSYDNLLTDISNFFSEGIKKAQGFGLERSSIILDPGIGFAKNYNQNLFLLRSLNAFDIFGLPILIGASRKSTIGRATGSESPNDRLEGTLAVTSLCAWHGVDIVRVHDAAANKKAVMMVEAIKGALYE